MIKGKHIFVGALIFFLFVGLLLFCLDQELETTNHDFWQALNWELFQESDYNNDGEVTNEELKVSRLKWFKDQGLKRHGNLIINKDNKQIKPKDLFHLLENHE